MHEQHKQRANSVVEGAVMGRVSALWPHAIFSMIAHCIGIIPSAVGPCMMDASRHGC